MKITALFTINVFLVLLGCAYSSPDTDEESNPILVLYQLK